MDIKDSLKVFTKEEWEGWISSDMTRSYFLYIKKLREEVVYNICNINVGKNSNINLMCQYLMYKGGLETYDELLLFSKEIKNEKF